jgi:hypothetical protein
VIEGSGEGVGRGGTEERKEYYRGYHKSKIGCAGTGFVSNKQGITACVKGSHRSWARRL